MSQPIHWSPAGIATLVFIIVAAYVWETLKRRRTPAAAYREMVTGREWQKWKMGLTELKRRGEDIEVYVPLFLQRMLHEQPMRREAARMTLSDVYPHLREGLQGIRATEPAEAVAAKLAPLLARYPLPDPGQTDVSTTGFVL